MDDDMVREQIMNEFGSPSGSSSRSVNPQKKTARIDYCSSKKK